MSFLALLSGRFLAARGAMFPALDSLGLTPRTRYAAPMRRWGADSGTRRTCSCAGNRWSRAKAALCRACYEGIRPVACDLSAFFRPQLQGCRQQTLRLRRGQSPAGPRVRLVRCCRTCRHGAPGVAPSAAAPPGRAKARPTCKRGLSRRPRRHACGRRGADRGCRVSDWPTCCKRPSCALSRAPAPTSRPAAVSCRSMRAKDGLLSAATWCGLACGREQARRLRPHRPTLRRVGTTASTASRHRYGTTWFCPTTSREPLRSASWRSPTRATKSRCCWQPTSTVLAYALWRLYRDRWAVEHLPLAAKPMLGAERAFVFGQESRYRLPELALLGGNMLTYVAATSQPVASGFWDRAARPTCGRLRRVLGRMNCAELPHLAGQLRKKNSVTAHLRKGIEAHRRHKAPALPTPAVKVT